MGKSVAIEVQGDLDTLRIVWSVVEAVLGEIPEARFKEEERYYTMVAVQEILTNIFRHGYDYDFDKPVRIELDVEDSVLEVTLIDQGPPFDPTGYDPPQDQDVLTKEGGYGIAIVAAVMDRTEYMRTENTNILVLTKDFGQPAPVPGAGGGGGQ